MYQLDIFLQLKKKIRELNLDKEELREILEEIVEEIQSIRYVAEQAYNSANGIEEWS